MTLATLDSLINGLNYEDMMYKFGQWYQDAKYSPTDEVFDIGKTTQSALQNYLYFGDKQIPLKCIINLEIKKIMEYLINRMKV